MIAFLPETLSIITDYSTSFRLILVDCNYLIFIKQTRNNMQEISLNCSDFILKERLADVSMAAFCRASFNDLCSMRALL